MISTLLSESNGVAVVLWRTLAEANDAAEG